MLAASRHQVRKQDSERKPLFSRILPCCCCIVLWDPDSGGPPGTVGELGASQKENRVTSCSYSHRPGNPGFTSCYGSVWIFCWACLRNCPLVFRLGHPFICSMSSLLLRFSDQGAPYCWVPPWLGWGQNRENTSPGHGWVGDPTSLAHFFILIFLASLPGVLLA